MELDPSERYQSRRKNYKKGIDSDDFRRRREDEEVQIRKTEKNAQLAAKRQQLLQGSTAGAVPGVDPQMQILSSAGGTTNGITAGSSGAASSSGGGHGGPVNIFPAGNAADVRAREMLPGLILQITSHARDENKLYDGVHEVRKLLSIEQNPPIQTVIDSGVVPLLIELLKLDPVGTPGVGEEVGEKWSKIVFECAWALTNIASGTREQTQVVIDAGGIPVFVKLLNSKGSEVREQAIWGLGNIAGDCTLTRDLVLNAGGLAPILESIKHSHSMDLLRNATWAISNLCRGRPPPPYEAITPALSVLQLLIYHQDLEVVIDASWALAYFCDGDRVSDRVDAIINAGVCKKTCELLGHTDYLVVIPALRLVGNICVGDDRQTDFIIDCNALPQLSALLSHDKKHIRKEACWCLSNITAGTPRQIEKVIAQNVMAEMIRLWPTADFDVKKEITWAVRNALASGTPEQLQYMLERGCLQNLCQMLDNLFDKRVINAVVEGIRFVLERGITLTGGDPVKFTTIMQECDAVEKLRNVRDATGIAPEVGQSADLLLRRYFDEDGDGMENGMLAAGLGNEAVAFGGSLGAAGAGGGTMNMQFSFGAPTESRDDGGAMLGTS